MVGPSTKKPRPANPSLSFTVCCQSRSTEEGESSRPSASAWTKRERSCAVVQIPSAPLNPQFSRARSPCGGRVKRATRAPGKHRGPKPGGGGAAGAGGSRRGSAEKRAPPLRPAAGGGGEGAAFLWGG